MRLLFRALRPVHREAPAQLDHLGRTRSITARRSLRLQHLAMKSATCSTSRTLKPRVVDAGVPRSQGRW